MLDSGSDLCQSPRPRLLAGPSVGRWLLRSNSEGCSSTRGRQTSWSQMGRAVSSGLFVVNRQLRQNYVGKVLG